MAVKSRLGNWLNPGIDSSSIAGLRDIALELAAGDRIIELRKDEELLSPLTRFK